MSLPIAWVLQDKPILLVGGGEVAETRVRKLAAAGAQVTVVAPELTEYIQGLVNDSTVRWFQRTYEKSDLKMEHWSMVLTAIDDHETSAKIAESCRKRHIPVNVADVPPLCDFYFGANFEQGPLKVMVSTGSGAPRLAKRVLNELASHAQKFEFAAAIRNVQQFRMQLRKHLPGSEQGSIQTRMRLMKTLCDKFTWAELAGLKQEHMEPMIRGMIISAAACPAQPAGSFDDAKDLVDDPAQAPGTLNKNWMLDSETLKGMADEARELASQVSRNENSVNEDNSTLNGADSSEEERSPTPETGKRTADIDDSINSRKRKTVKKQQNGSGDEGPERKRHASKEMKLSAVECDKAFPTPKAPGFPFRSDMHTHKEVKK